MSDETKLIAYCGNDCSWCPRYIATQSGELEQLREVARIWQKAGWRDGLEPPEKMACHGCLSADWCRYSIRQCAEDKGVDICGRCPDYPCPIVIKVFERTGQYAARCKEVLPAADFQRLQKAFFNKKDNLDRISKK